MSNWVERMAQQKELLPQKAGDVWENTRSAMQDACDSYRKYYAQVECVLENGNRFRVSRIIERVKKTVRVSFDQAASNISVARDSESPNVFAIQADEDRVFLADAHGNEITADQFSELALKPLLFPEKRWAAGSYRTVAEDDDA